MVKIFIDPGHGGSDPGASANGLLEKNITLSIGLSIRDILTTEYENVQIKMSRTTDTTVSLTQRTQAANAFDADYYVSIHCNAGSSGSQGYEDFIYNGLPPKSTAAKHQDIMHEAITNVNRIPDRGQKTANFHVLRESNMSAILTENGFITNSIDARLLKDPAYRRMVARGHVNGLVKIFNIEKKNQGATYYRVITGSFTELENARERQDALEAAGFNSFVVEETIDGELYYRVVTGSFTTRHNAELRVNGLQAAGFDSFIETFVL